jgi:glycosyltransferase involved in cell wall biosynthesis
VDHGHTGFLVPGRHPERFAAYVARLLDDSDLARRMSVEAASRARRYTWSFAAARLRRVYADVASRALVSCS